MTQPSTRRNPKQGRGQERVNAILDAAAALLAETGLESLTTNAVAARADTHIGSLYHFFPNKEAILEALAGRYMNDMRTLWDTVFSADAVLHAPTADMIDQMIEQFAAFEAQHIGFQSLLYGSGAPDTLQSASEKIGSELVERIASVMGRRYPALPASRLISAAAVMLGAVKMTMPNALPGVSPAADALRTELKRMLTAYLDTMETE